jgi:hypothetical protein
MNFADAVMNYAIEFMECLKGLMDEQKIFINTYQIKASEAKRELLQLVSQKLWNNDVLRDKVREMLAAFKYDYVEENDIYLNGEQSRCKHACKMEFERYRRSMQNY